MSSDRQLNYVNDLQNRDQKLYYVDDASELNSINLEENDKIYAINDNKLFQMEIADQEEELSGSIVSFNGRNNTKIKSLVANIEPSQDLHGYDHPWPAGGGSQLLNIEDKASSASSGVTFEIADTTIKASGTSTTGVNFIIIPSSSPIVLKAGQYTLSITGNSNASVQIRRLTGSPAVIEYANNTRKSVTFTLENDENIWVNLNISTAGSDVLVNCKIKLEVGSTATAWTPYSNICPISGQTGADIYGTGINVWDEEWENGYFNNDTGVFYPAPTNAGIASKNFIPVVPDSYYWIKNPTSLSARAFFYDLNKNYLGYTNVRILNSEIHIPVNCAFIKFTLFGYGAGIYNHDISINYPSTDTTYHAYTGNQISVTFPSAAGTVYGAMLTINPNRTGTLVVDRATILMTGDTAVSYDTSVASPRFFIAVSGFIYSNNLNPPLTDISNIYGNANGPFSPSSTVTGFTFYGNRIYWRDSRFTSVAEMKQYFADMVTAGTPVTFCGHLIEPVVYTLTESEISSILSTFLGTNNIWSNIGDITVKIAEKGITAFELAPHI